MTPERSSEPLSFAGSATADRLDSWKEIIPKLIQPGLGVSPDGRWLLYTQMDQFGSDLNLVDDFR